MAVTGAEGLLLLAGRVLFGGVLAFMGLNHFLQTDQMVGYAEHEGLPAPGFAVLASGAVLVLSGVGIAVGAFPVLGALVLAGFLVVSAATMHDFWAVAEDEQQAEMTNFLKNVALAGGALGIAALGSQGWAYGLGLRLL
jgi:uncharacterized membrane protein YphA (DoxX/SURF4 family)